MRKRIAVSQPIGDCRWSRTGIHFTGIHDERDQPESRWVCIRKAGVRRSVVDVECEECPHWEPDETTPSGTVS